MLFWPAVVLMTGAAVLAVLWPLSRVRETEAACDADLAVYRDQLDEIERDRARGVLPEGQAEAARIEVSRRLLAAGERRASGTAPGALYRRRVAAVIALAGIPLFTLAVYAAVGSPAIPDAPLAARLAKPPEQQDIAMLVRRIEAHLAQNPDDARGWAVLAPVYLRMGRAADAVKARENILRLEGSNAAREADLGEALVAAESGFVDAQARAAFERALAHDPENTKAKFYLELAARQQSGVARP